MENIKQKTMEEVRTMEQRGGERGFMLIELLIVIAIILILASIGIRKVMYAVEAEKAIITDSLQDCILDAMVSGKIGKYTCVLQYKDSNHKVAVNIESSKERTWNPDTGMYEDVFRFYIEGQRDSNNGYVQIKSLRGNIFECKINNVEEGLTNKAYVDCRVPEGT